MPEFAPMPVESSSGLFPIRTVSQLTGVNAITLRAWENRHDLIRPVRRESGHRLYRQEHIDRINRIVGLLDRGMRIGQVKAVLDAESAPDEDGQAAASRDGWRRYVEGFMAGIIRFDETMLEAVYNEAMSLHPENVVTAKVIVPLLNELGSRWERSLGTVAEEHFFGFYLRNKLGARFHHRKQNQTGPKLVMACLPGERHEVGLLLFALTCNDAGYRPVILGSDMPLAELAPAAVKIGAAAILLSGFRDLPEHLILQELSSLRAQTRLPLMLGGRASVASFDALRRIGVEPLGVDVTAALRRLQELLPAADDSGH